MASTRMILVALLALAVKGVEAISLVQMRANDQLSAMLEGNHTSRAAVDTCALQKPCINFTVNPVEGPCNSSNSSGAACQYEVCISVDSGATGCEKNGSSISHACYDGDAECQAGFPTKKDEDIFTLTTCQKGAGGSTVYFIFKDGNSNGTCANETFTGDFGATISCGQNPGWTNMDGMGCSGVANECLWNITLPDCVTCSTCVIWGDPHIITFREQQKRLLAHPRREAFFRTRGWKEDQITIRQAGNFWLVKSDTVKIEAAYTQNETTGTTALSQLALGGSFLGGGVLIVRPLNGNTTWNGANILEFMPSTFANQVVQASYHNSARLVKDGSNGPGLDLALPMGVTLTINRWKDSMAAEINMCPTLGQSGQCGDYTGTVY